METNNLLDLNKEFASIKTNFRLNLIYLNL